MSGDFKRETLTNAFAHAAVESGVAALQRLYSDANIGNTLASEISAAVVEAARTSVIREAAHHLLEQAVLTSTPRTTAGDVVRRDAVKKAAQRLSDWADTLDEEYRQRHQSPTQFMKLLECIKADYLELETNHRYVFRDRGESGE